MHFIRTKTSQLKTTKHYQKYFWEIWRAISWSQVPVTAALNSWRVRWLMVRHHNKPDGSRADGPMGWWAGSLPRDQTACQLLASLQPPARFWNVPMQIHQSHGHMQLAQTHTHTHIHTRTHTLMCLVIHSTLFELSDISDVALAFGCYPDAVFSRLMCSLSGSSNGSQGLLSCSWTVGPGSWNAAFHSCWDRSHIWLELIIIVWLWAI